MLLPDFEMELAERLAISRPLTCFTGELAQSFDVGIAVRQAGVDGVPDRFVLPVTVPRRFEDDRQEAWILHPNAQRQPKLMGMAPGGAKNQYRAS